MKKLITTLFFVGICLLSSFGTAAPLNGTSSHSDSGIPLIRTAEVSMIDYKAFLATEPAYIAFSEALIRMRPSRSAALELRRLFEEAERVFLSASPIQAHEAYLRVVELSHAEDWGLVQRKMIFHSYLRAAQTSDTNESRRSLLVQALQFDDEEEADATLFPPPLVEELNALKKEYTKIEVSVPPILRKFEFALINGKKVLLNKMVIKVPMNVFRLTLVSNFYAPLTRQLTAEEMASWKPVLVPLTTGTCRSPTFHRATAELGAHAIFPNECVAVRTQNGGNHIAGEQTPFRESKRIMPLTYNQPVNPLNVTATKKSSEPFYSKKWFWILSGAAVAAIVASNQKREDPPPRPTVKDGF